MRASTEILEDNLNSTEECVHLRHSPSAVCLRCASLLPLVCCVALLAKTASWADPYNRPVVVVRIDDCQTSWLTPFSGLGGVNGLTYGKSKQIPITWAVISSFASLGGSMTWAQIKDYLDTCGGEPASHSVNHSPMSTQQDYLDELVNSKTAIEANLPGYQCRTFIQPGTWTGDAYMDSFSKLDNPIGQAIQANYAQSLAYLGGGWRVGHAYYPHGTSNTYSIDAQSLPTIPGISSVLDVVATTPGLVFIISGHGVQEQGGTGTYKVPADVLKATMDKLADLRDQGKIRLMSLDGAFRSTFSPDLNRMPNPDFELINHSQSYNGWSRSGSTQALSTGGINDSGYCSLPDSTAKITSSSLILPPGRYEMSWYQKVVDAKANSGLVLAFAAMNQKNQQAMDQSVLCVNWAFFYNSAPVTDWQKKSVLAHVRDRLNLSQITFQPASGGGYGIDNVSIVSAPIDPAVSPSASTVTPDAGQCTISWHTPDDPSVTSVVVRYNARTHPLTPTSGTAVSTVPTLRDTVQEITVPFNWTALSNAYFSVFGVRSDSSFTPPDLALVKIDTSPPTAPSVSLTVDQDGTLYSQWTSSEPDSQIMGYQYAVGHDPGGNDLRNWTTTTDTSATITGIPWGTGACVSVKAQNLYGFWSNYGSARMYLPVGLSLAATLPNGRSVSVSGRVTAVFSDCCYIEDNKRTRGIKIVGDASGYQIGQYITVNGLLATRNGERYVSAHQPAPPPGP